MNDCKNSLTTSMYLLQISPEIGLQMAAATIVALTSMECQMSASSEFNINYLC